MDIEDIYFLNICDSKGHTCTGTILRFQSLIF